MFHSLFKNNCILKYTYFWSVDFNFNGNSFSIGVIRDM